MPNSKEGLPQGQLFPSLRRRRRASGPPVSALLLLVGFAGGALGGWLWLARGAAPTVPRVDAASEGFANLPVPQSEAEDAPLPTLAASDRAVRELLLRLSAHPQWAAWLIGDDLVRRFVKSAVDLARGSTPASHLEAAAPGAPFTTEVRAGTPVISQASYRRYDLLVETFVSLDTGAGAALYHRMHPLFEEAYAELGASGRDFDETFALALRNLVSARVPEERPALARRVQGYGYADPRLEGRSPAEKQMMRLGPENARRVQEKARAIGSAIGIALP